MPAPIALQLYTVREAMSQGFEPIVRKVAEIGYVGVEPAGFPGTTPEAAAKLFQSLGLQVPSAHMGLPLGDQQKRTLDVMQTLGCKRMVNGMGPDQFKTVDLIRRTCDTLNEADAVARARGMVFCYHNHWWEFEKLDGRLVFDIMLERLAPTVLFEIDTYWVKTGGSDPAAEVRKAAQRAPLLHIKDGPCVQGKPMTAVGDGTMDFRSIVKAGGKHTEWMIVELDFCAGDMMDAVKTSYTYLTGEKLARGNA